MLRQFRKPEKRDEIQESYRDVAGAAITCLDEGFESATTAMILPEGMRRFYRTSNHIECLNKELKRRSKVIGIFPNEDSLLRLMGSVLIERHEAVQNGQAVFSKARCEALLKSGTPLQLVELAEE